MILPTSDRAVYLLAVGFALSLCVLNAPLMNAKLSPQSVAVEDVQRILAGDKGKPDAEVARQLSGLVLKERMSDAILQSLEQSVPGTESRWALVALADTSVFLPPPAADVLAQAPPDLKEQRRRIALTVNYLGKTLPKLPNFYARRTTIRYGGDVPAGATYHDDSSWREVGSSKVIVVYRDGKEVVDPSEWVKHPSHPEGGSLVTVGTFGPILSTVIVDAAHGEMRWERWERGGAGTLAVFRYSVPENQSHYSLAFDGFSKKAGAGTEYHGEVAIDPATGTIQRLTVQADPPLGSPVLRGDIMVEYGAVDIGGKTYTCPIRSVSFSIDAEGLADESNPFGQSVQTPQAILLNDVKFEDYHLFRSDSRILTGTTPAPDH